MWGIIFAKCKLAQQNKKKQNPKKRPLKSQVGYMGSQWENKQDDKFQRNLIFCSFIVTFITRSHSCFWAPPASITQGGFWTYMYLQTSLTICTLICFREIRPRDSSTVWPESFKAILEVCGTGIVQVDQGEESLFSGKLRYKREGLKQENRTGWLCAHMSAFILPWSETIWGLKGLSKKLKTRVHHVKQLFCSTMCLLY